MRERRNKMSTRGGVMEEEEKERVSGNWDQIEHELLCLRQTPLLVFCMYIPLF